ncbi:MAG: DUF4912 domain-containing protein, partial [Arthrospira platensis PCC 7345]|nr:DUF4912 domain-containing protein [Arthrospira platensis PCC 7345]
STVLYGRGRWRHLSRPLLELTQEWYIPVPMSDRDYIVEIGYVTDSGHWLVLARSESVHIPPVYPCDHYGDRFYTISWEENLRGKNI